jgi:hypothetical protein
LEELTKRLRDKSIIIKENEAAFMSDLRREVKAFI